ncbi:MAG: cytochrome C [Negativicutes bacterium]|nr:cytochrome C [Negativicutes bacterium]
MRITPVMMGIITAFLAVAAQAYLFLQPPPAYGLCVVCHGRDLTIWLTSALFGLKRDVAVISYYWPLLTVAGIFLGSRYAAITSAEYRPVAGENPWVAFGCGMAVMILGLLIMGCPTRLLLRAAYGDILGAVGMGSILLGVVAATLVMRRRAGA